MMYFATACGTSGYFGKSIVFKTLNQGFPSQTSNDLAPLGHTRIVNTSEIITIRCAGWISGRRVNLQPDTDIKNGKNYQNCQLSNGTRIRRRISETVFSIFRGFKLLERVAHVQCTSHNHLFNIFGSIFSAFCAMTPSLSVVKSQYRSVVACHIDSTWQDFQHKSLAGVAR